MKNLMCILLFFFLAASSISIYAHGGNEDSEPSQPSSTQGETIGQQESNENQNISEVKIPAAFNDFPNLHPLVVHFPIVLLMMAAVLALLNIVLVKRDLAWIITCCSLFGLIAAYIARSWFHAHVGDAPEHIKDVFEKHEQAADWTFYIAIAGFIVQAASQFIFKQKRWAVALAAFILVLAAVSVGVTGHLGSQLVYIEGAGPQGKYLEHEHD